MKHIIVVNGTPCSGKSTFETSCKEILEKNYDGSVCIVSTIDQVKYIYGLLGWNGIGKTDEDRKNMSDLKQMYINKCNGPVRDLFNMVCKDINDDEIFFVDCRETAEIHKLYEIFSPLSIIGIKFTSVYIDRKNDHDYGNDSDNVSYYGYPYEYYINNNGSLIDLYKQADEFIKELIFFGLSSITKHQQIS